MRILFLIFIVFLLFSCSAENKSENKLEINKNGYSISYPDQLSTDESIDGLEFIIFTEKSNPDDDFIENINLIIQDLDSLNIDLHDYARISEQQIVENNGEIISYDLKKNYDQDFYRFMYNMPMNDNHLSFLQHFYLSNSKVYILTFSSEMTECDNYVKEMEEIMLSFQLREIIL